MRILLLSGNTGEGHNSAAKALKEYFESRGCQCDIHDGLQYMRFSSGRFISWGHIVIYRKLPFVFGIGYRYAQWLQSHTPFQKKLNARTKKMARRLPPRRRRLKEFIEKGNYDAVIAVHSFIAAMTSDLRKCGALDIPSFFLATDYSCYPGVNQMEVDAWMVPHRNLIPEYIALGVPEDRIVVTGIPVRSEFFTRQDRTAVRRELGLPEDKKIVVLSCGSMGASSMGRMVVALTETLPDNALLVAICGKNKVLERNLRKIVRSKKLMVLGFVDRMSAYMDAADLFITKPGGLSTSEAVHKRVPTVLVHAVPGCETGNLKFMTAIGCAATAKGPISAAKLVSETLKTGKSLDYLAQKCEAEFTGNAAQQVYETVMQHINAK
ncbi:MAG: hypothetical protein IJA26_00880 [Clostridia bacterium]|nr:hypothetical protein [Clostridia bacterium]